MKFLIGKKKSKQIILRVITKTLINLVLFKVETAIFFAQILHQINLKYSYNSNQRHKVYVLRARLEYPMDHL